MSKFAPSGGSTYRLGASISSTDTSIRLASFLEPISGTPYTMALMNTDIAYGTIAPQTSQSEFISFTGITQNADGTATLTGVVRGLSRSYPFTTSATFKLPHSGQSTFILSDSPQEQTEYAIKRNAETVSGDWTFTGNTTFTVPPVSPATPDASTTTKGFVKTSVAPAVASNPIAVETTDPRVPVAYAVDSAGTDSYAITPSPAITAYAEGQKFSFKAGTANTGAASLNVNGLGAKTIKKDVSSDLVTGDILVGQIVECRYDGTNMQMVSLKPQVPNKFSSGTFTKNLDDASGTQTIAHGLGVTPSKIRFWGMCVESSTGTLNKTCTGVYDNGTQKFMASQGVNGTGIAYITGTGNIFAIDTYAGSGNGYTGSITVDATNITITWTKIGGNGFGVGSHAGFIWEAQN